MQVKCFGSYQYTAELGMLLEEIDLSSNKCNNRAKNRYCHIAIQARLEEYEKYEG